MQNIQQNTSSCQALKIEIYENILKAKDTNKQPAFLFDRVSTIEQKLTGLSLQYQSNFGNAYADGKDLYIVYSFEVAESGRKDTQRKHFKSMLELAIDLDIKHLIFKSVDRMSRNYKDLSAILDLIDQQDFTIHFYQQNKAINKNSTHDEKFMIGIEQTVAKHTSDKISYDVKQSNLFRASNGIYPIGSNRHYGYQYDLKEKKWIINQEEKKTVEYILSEISANNSLQTICDALNAKGIKSSRGGRWNKSSLHKLVSNPFYKGSFIYQHKEWQGNHEPYLTDLEFEQIQKQLKLKNRTKRGRGFLFKGFLHNAQTKRLLTGGYKTGANNSGEYIYYSHMKPYANYRENDIIKAINKKVNELEFDPAFEIFLREALKYVIENKKEINEKELKNIIYRITELESENNKLLDAMLKDNLDRQTVKRRMDENRKSIELLVQEQHHIKINKEDFTVEVSVTIDDLRRFPELYLQSTNNQERASLIREAADRICVISENGKNVEDIKIHWNYFWSLLFNIYKNFEMFNADTVYLYDYENCKLSKFCDGCKNFIIKDEGRASLPENSLDAPSALGIEFRNDDRCIPKGI